MNSRTETTSRLRQARGFTILELLIATVVFSLVLLLLTVGILQFSRTYYKGFTETQTQNTARNVVETISQAIQFSGGTVIDTPTTGGTDRRFCIGNQQFAYRLGWQVENQIDTAANQGWHGLVQRDVAGCAAAAVPNLAAQTIPSPSGRDLVGQHMRVSNLAVRSVGSNLYQVTVRIVYGDNDLLTNPTGTTARCSNVARGALGSGFCSSVELSTIVVKRVE